MRKLTWLVVAGMSAVLALPVAQADETAAIYGRQLMTQEEIQAHQDKMRAAQTAEERERIRAEQHEMIQQRAKEKGVDLPDDPPPRGHINRQDRPGMGQGMGGGTGGGHGYGRP